jgi:hypothetical protein
MQIGRRIVDLFAPVDRAIPHEPHVDTTSATLDLDGDWDAKNLVDASGVQFTQITVLSSTLASAKTYPNGASIEIVGPLRIMELFVGQLTQTSITKTSSGLSLRFQHPRGWMASSNPKKTLLTHLLITVGAQAAKMKIASDVEQEPTLLPPGTRLAATIGGTQDDGATVDLTHPSA